MTDSIHKKKIELAFKSGEFIKIVYFYPEQEKFFTFRGIIIDVSEDGFEIEDIKDGKVSRSFDYIVETKLTEREI